MRVDGAGARTWLLAATAAWALAAWLLAIAGMGGRVEAPVDDPTLLRPLPALPRPVDSRLGPLAQYTEIAARPLFSQDRRPKPFSLQPTGDAQVQAFDYVLTSVMITPSVRMAILQNPDGSQSLRVKLGEAPEGQPAWRLVALNSRSAVFSGPDGERTMDLRVFDGRGGQAPTAVVAPAPRPAGGPALPPGSVERPGRVGVVEVSPGQPADPAAVPAPAPPTPIAGSTAAPSPEQAQMEAIRKRIEARRAALRQEAQQNQQTPPTPPQPTPPNR
ncbi:MAG: hypothetical protein NDI66_09100 [Pseudomonas sp.]|nr:hypothetical protein [Pseudomonas sp.]